MFAEGALQLFYRISVGKWLADWWAIPIYEEDSIRGYRLKANLDYTHKTSEFTATYLTDNAGMRTDSKQSQFLLPKPKSSFRILSLGPSFAFGWAVNYEDAYMHRIAEGLRVPGKQIELVNLGTPSQAPCYQLKWLREKGYLYQPDLVIQTIYADLDQINSDDSLPQEGPCVKNGYLYPTRHLTLGMRIRLWRRYSALLFYGWQAYQRLSGSKTGVIVKQDQAGNTPLPEKEMAACVELYNRYIQFIDSVVTNKPPVVFIYVPQSWVVRPSDISRVAHHGPKPDPFVARERSALLTIALTNNQVNLIDTTSALIEADKESRTYFLYDTHFTPWGNKAVADYALPIVQRLIPR